MRRRRDELLDRYFDGVVEAVNRSRPLAKSPGGRGIRERIHEQGFYDARNGRVLRPHEVDLGEILRRAEVREVASASASPTSGGDHG